MKVFISWSGDRSKALATALKELIPLVLQNARPFVSDKDISAGDRWAKTVATELESANFGILCVTPENIKSEWILFEAGALSKSMQDGKVIPLLYDLELRELSGPLSQFQAIKVEEKGLFSVLKAINTVSDTKTEESNIEKLVPLIWPQLQSKLDSIPKHENLGKQARTQTEVLEDLVSQIRGINSRFREIDMEISEKDTRLMTLRPREMDARSIDEMMHFLFEASNTDMSLLVIAGFIRDKMPWLAEVLIQAHQELKTANSKDINEIGGRLTRFVHQATSSPMAERIMGRSKANHILLMEIPRLIDHAVSLKIENRMIGKDRTW
ncbi:toll/interleukin-1 receptor domain-containing protein [Novispirillum itersonii]|uniref:toll/interleukin-1 receptor domain-containing protein n=1 Tax=Novispirillum itersonii TaxID=189 RepID=UPI000379448D|nr:toll/interleukin-1 receptor domain-containing protein [Novispirillum itersonii]